MRMVTDINSMDRRYVCKSLRMGRILRQLNGDGTGTQCLGRLHRMRDLAVRILFI